MARVPGAPAPEPYPVLASAAVLGRDPVRAFFDTSSYLDRNAIIPVRARIVTEMLARASDGHVLDLGCGDGSISRPLLAARNRLTLVDFSASMLDRARAATPPGAPVEFVQADILSYVAGAQFGAVICVGVLAHVGSVEQAVARVSSALSPGGLGVLQITDNASPIGRLLNRYYRRRRRQSYEMNVISLAELVAIGVRYGLAYRRSRRYGLLLPGLGRLPYLWERRLEEVVGFSQSLSRVGAEVMVCFEKAQNQ